MKKIIVTIIAIFSAFAVNAQINYGTNTVTGSNASAIGDGNTASGVASFAGGINSEALGQYSVAFGNEAKAGQRNGISLGYRSFIYGPYAVGIGENIMTTSTSAMVIGSGVDDNTQLINDISRSLMIGYNSDIPTFFVGSSFGPGTLGKVGIGTTTPTTLLDVNGTLNVEDAATLRDDLSVSGGLSVNNASTFANNLSVGGTMEVTGAATFANNLSIGGTMDVTDAATFGNNLTVSNKTTTQELQITGGAGAGKVLTSDADGNASWEEMQIPESVWSENNGNVFVQNANVGIGTDNPLGKLHIDMGTDKPDFIWTSTDNTNSLASDIKFITDASDGNTVFSTFTGNWAPTYKWQCGMQNSKAIYTAMSLDLASWGTKLRLHGDLLCEQVEVMENVPNSDFVFEEDYKLMSLRELESYLKEHHHLPEIPSAAEFKENGYNMNDMDDLLLRKVEELTLYIIALEKKVADLEDTQK